MLPELLSERPEKIPGAFRCPPFGGQRHKHETPPRRRRCANGVNASERFQNEFVTLHELGTAQRLSPCKQPGQESSVCVYFPCF